MCEFLIISVIVVILIVAILKGTDGCLQALIGYFLSCALVFDIYRKTFEEEDMLDAMYDAFATSVGE